MGQDFYAILNLTRSAGDEAIKKAYRKLALKFHPEKNPPCKLTADRFAQLSEAYDILSDPRKRAVYDQYGEEGLRNGIPNPTAQGGIWTQGYTFHGNANKIFRDFFGGDNPFNEFGDRIETEKHLAFGGLRGQGAKKQDPPIERELALSLEEIYHGCIKKMQIARRVMNEDGHTSSTREKILTVCVKKGWKPGTRITFSKEGDQGPNNIPADIVFIIKDKPHARFRREGLNLVHPAKVSLGRALTGCIIPVETLNDRLLHIPINDIIQPGYTKTVPKEGMPIVENPEMKGDLVIEFQIEFPPSLKSENKDLIRKALLS